MNFEFVPTEVQEKLTEPALQEAAQPMQSAGPCPFCGPPDANSLPAARVTLPFRMEKETHVV